MANGKIVVNNDEWTLCDEGFEKTPDIKKFVQNIINWFSGGKKGKILIASTNFGLTQSHFQSTLKDAGFSLDVNPTESYTAEFLSQYCAVFLAGNEVDNAALTSYVKGGGCVYLAGGTGWGGAEQEADRWKALLNAFGLKFEPAYNGVDGCIAVNSNHPIFDGVTQLFQENGSPVTDIDPESTANQIVLSSTKGGLIAVYDSSCGEDVVITNINYDGQEKGKEGDEYIELTNKGYMPADISGWKIQPDEAKEVYVFPKGIKLDASMTIRVYTNQYHADSGGFSFGHGARALWNNKGGKGTLFNLDGKVIDTYTYPK